MSNCNLADVCKYGGSPKANGSQDCSCLAAPDCNSKTLCSLGLGGTPKADGTQGCNCVTYKPMSVSISLSSAYISGGLPPYYCTIQVGPYTDSVTRYSEGSFSTGYGGWGLGDGCDRTTLKINCTDAMKKSASDYNVLYGSGGCQ